MRRYALWPFLKIRVHRRVASHTPECPVMIVIAIVLTLYMGLRQVERHHKSGEKNIEFPDGTRKAILPCGREISEFPDGVTVVEYPEVCG